MNEEWAVTIIEETMDSLAVGISHIICILDPGRIVVGGGAAGSADVIIPMLEERLARLVPNVPSMVPWQLGTYASAYGTLYAATCREN